MTEPGPRRLGWDEPAPADMFDRINPRASKEEPMSVMESYVESISDAALIDLAERDLVASQARYVMAEVERRGLELE